ncbi:MAG: hypothetical protein KKH70_20280 [Gammaproteobacteria bacterium]|nr:hypothetical protein [Gammaproteobacteria bacterium]
MDQETVNRCRREAEEAYIIFSDLRDKAAKAEEDYLKKSRRFSNFDYELAMTDGRFKRVKAWEKNDKVVKQPEMTMEQLLHVAQILGIKLTVEEPAQLEEEVSEDGQES